MILKIVVGIIGTALGISMMIKTEWYLRTIGRVAWAEKYLGLEGGSRLFYKLLGFLVMILAWFYMFDWWNGLLEFLLGGLFRGGKTD